MTIATHDAVGIRRPDNLLTRMLAFATTTHARAVAMLVGVCLLAMLPGFFQIPPIDREEARFAQASKQMLETGDLVDIRFQDQVRYKKPIGIYWLQASVVKAAEFAGVSRARTRIWLYRIPSLLGAIGAVLLTYWAGLAFVTRRAAVLAALMMAASVLLGIEARLAKTDAVLLMAAVAAMGALGRLYVREREAPGADRDLATPAILWSAIALGALIKGPLILLFVGLPALALSIADRSTGWLRATRPALGVLWAAVLTLPWFVAIYLQTGGRFFVDALGSDLLAKVVSGQDSHSAPPGYYLALFWLTFWPGAVLAGLAALPLWRLREEPGVRFLLAWVLPAWLLFELVVAKLPHYVLPIYPAIAILLALAVERKEFVERAWIRAGTAWWFGFPLLIFAICIAVMVSTGKSIGLLSWPVAVAAATFGAFAWRLYSRMEAENSLLKGIAAALLLSIAVYGLLLPSLNTLSASSTIEWQLREDTCDEPRLASAGYHEPSLVFLAGTETVLTDARGAAEFLREGGCRFAAIEGRQLRNFLQHAESLGLRYDAVGRRIESTNLARGRKVTISLFRARSDP